MAECKYCGREDPWYSCDDCGEGVCNGCLDNEDRLVIVYDDNGEESAHYCVDCWESSDEEDDNTEESDGEELDEKSPVLCEFCDAPDPEYSCADCGILVCCECKRNGRLPRLKSEGDRRYCLECLTRREATWVCFFCREETSDWTARHWCDSCRHYVCEACKSAGWLVKKSSGEDPDVGRYCLTCWKGAEVARCHYCRRPAEYECQRCSSSICETHKDECRYCHKPMCTTGHDSGLCSDRCASDEDWDLYGSQS